MADTTDLEGQSRRDEFPVNTAANEQTPLLGHGPPYEGEPEGDKIQKDEGRLNRVRWYLWRITWIIIFGLLLAVFIKGWVDAGSDVNFDFKDALRKAFGSGVSGAAAMLLQVLLLMPLRTIMNYQYRFGTSFTTATKTLYQEEGLRRYYRGIGAAVIQAPAARFGDTAANAGILALLQSNSYLKDLPSLGKTVFASLCAAGFRMILTPIDTLKTTLQAQGAEGMPLLRQRIRKHGLGTLWWGAFATAGATFVGHYPWFSTYNLLTELIEEPEKTKFLLWLLRLAFIAFVASVVSDSVSNSLRVVKTYRQVNDTQVSYVEAMKLVVRDDGISGLLGRGLRTRILSNGLQGILFSILWKLFTDRWEGK
ncbi:mitochondrial carrier domain-containing protein [Stachybotrys elegans]|uniref:Mitochondrial carrier domain-containing protein n=1 Tax=Stachybotrys elegans TaxID=80388 RepID=A0A8K0WJR5_9HYPO|nr:mitochondrial carrier domain-containing protein [Stachybotrys elegans]